MFALITTRSDYNEKYNETRDSIDNRLVQFLLECGISSVLIPNNLDSYQNIISDINFDVIVLSGGGSTDVNDTESLARIQIEQLLLNYAIKHRKAVLGICRGMQAIANYFGGKLVKIDNHTKIRHYLYDHTGTPTRETNSYHDYALKDNLEDFETLFTTQDGNIEAIKHKSYPIIGIMWHPEREDSFDPQDIQLVKDLIADCNDDLKTQIIL